MCCNLNVSYGDSFRQKLDIFGADLPKTSPILVYIHGGYWQALEKYSSAYAVKPYVEKGSKVIVVDYDLCPQVTLEELIEQIRKCMVFILNYANENGVQSVSVSGHSAGAHVMSFLVDQDFKKRVGKSFELFDCFYFISGVYCLKELRNTESVNKDNLLSISDENVEQLSPMCLEYGHLAESKIKLYIIVGENDPPTFIQQTNEFHGKLSDLKAKSEQILVNEVDHFDIVEKLCHENYLISQLIIQNFN